MPDGPFDVELDITVVDGTEGRRLAALQAKAILDVLAWFQDRANGLHQGQINDEILGAEAVRQHHHHRPDALTPPPR